MIGQIFTGEAIDVENQYKYTYPKSRQEMEKVRADFDFIFTKYDLWFYMSSANDSNLFTSMEFNLNLPVENAGESWKVINARTGEIILEGSGKQ